MRPLDLSLLNIFASEQAEHVERIRSLLGSLALASGEAFAAALEEIQRRAHTLKGAAHAVGLESSEAVVHALEHVFSRIRRQGGGWNEQAQSLAEQALEAVEDILVAAQADRQEPDTARLQSALTEFGAGRGAPSAPAAPAQDAMEPGGKPTSPAGDAATGDAATGAAASNGAPADSDLMRVSASRIDDLVRSSSDLLVSALLDSEASNPFEENAQYLGQLQTEWRQMRRGVRNGSTSENVREDASAADLRKANHCLNFIDRQLEILERRAQAAAAKWGARTYEVRRRAETLYDDACMVRMTPADTVFSGFGAMVRDLAQQQNKPVEFRSEGLETQADRRVLQMLKDPVLHLLRNAVSHGAESEQARIAAGKPPVTTIRLRIHSRGDRLNLSVEDNGRGIDAAAVIEEAVRRGVLPPDSRDPAKVNVARLLLLPGLSTAKQVSKLAGRGIGLSIVQEAVTRLHGDVSIRGGPAGGTTIWVTVPLAMSTQHVLFVEAAGATFGLPTTFIAQLLRIGLSDIQTIEGRESILVDSKAVRLARLTDLLSIPTAPAQQDATTGIGRDAREETPKLFVAVAEVNGERLAIVVDSLRDERDAIIKDTGLSSAQSGFSAGAVPMDDGSVAVVLSVPELFARAGAGADYAAFRTPKVEQKVASILVVDDSLTTRSLEKSILEAHGYHVRVAVDGLQALEQIRTERPDLVISDVMMPRMTGFELLAAIKADASLKGLPVILVTSLESREEQARGLELGADAYIVKHRFDQRELLRIVRQIV